jgi:hypothetical protein
MRTGPIAPSSLSVLVNDDGDLIIWCNIHQEAIKVFIGIGQACDCEVCKAIAQTTQ